MYSRRMQRSATCLVAAIAVAVAIPCAAADPQAQMEWQREQGSQHQWTWQQSGTFTPMLVNANPLIGHDVTSPQGEKLGTITDLVFNNAQDRISYVAVQSGGMLGAGAKHLAIPWEAFSIRSTSRSEVQTVTLNATKQAIDAAPGFDAKSWPAQPSMHWQQLSQKPGGTYGYQPSGSAAQESPAKSALPQRVETGAKKTAEAAVRGGQEEAERTARESVQSAAREEVEQTVRESMESGARESVERTGREQPERAAERYEMRRQQPMAQIPAMRFRRTTELIGLDVKNARGEEVGNLEDIVLDQREGRPVFAVLGFGGLMGLGEKMAAVPWSAMSVNSQQEMARIKADRSLLESIAYAPDQPTDLANVSEAQRLYQHFDEQPYWQSYGYVAPSGAEGWQQMSWEAWKSGSEFNSKFDAASVITKEGTITSVGTFRPASGAADGLRLHVHFNDGQRTTVYAGPRQYASMKGMALRYGDKVTVKGSQAEIKGRQVILASEIHKGDQRLDLRDSQGSPQWSVSELQSGSMQESLQQHSPGMQRQWESK